MEAPLTDNQRERFIHKVHFGHTLPAPKTPPKSSIIVQEKQLNLYIDIKGKHKAISLLVSSQLTVGQLLHNHLGADLELNERPYVFYGEDVMNYNDKLADWDVRDQSLIRVRPRELTTITVTIKLLGVENPIQELSANQSWETIMIKNNIADFLSVQPYTLKLFMGGRELEDSRSLADIGIYTNCTLIAQYCKPKGLKGSSTVILRGYSKYEISTIGLKDNIMAFDTATSQKIYQKPKMIEEHKIQPLCRVQLENNTQVECSEGAYFYTMDKRWAICSETEREGLKIGDQIMIASKEFVAVRNIYFNMLDHQRFHELFHIHLNEYTPYFAKGVLICPALDIQVLFRGNYSTILTSFDMHPSMTIAMLKEKIHKRLGVNPRSQFLFIESRQLSLRDNTEIRSFFDPKIIVQLSLRQEYVKSLIETEKTVIICFDDVTKRLSYNRIEKKTCRDIVAEEFRDKFERFPYFGVLFEKELIDLDTSIMDIVPKNSQAFFYDDFTLTVIKFPERFRLAQIIKQYPPQPQQAPFYSKILSFMLSNTPEQAVLKKYKQNYLRQSVRQILKNLHVMNINDATYRQQFCFISELYNYFSKQLNHFGECFRVLPDKKEVQNMTVNGIINFRQFLSCCPDERRIQGQLTDRIALLKIKSISGKMVNLGKECMQIVFMPYTYFIINKIEINQNGVTEVLLSQMPTSLAFDKPLLIWVDDEPPNNQPHIDEWQAEQGEAEIVQLTSTCMAKRWFSEFGWLANRRNLSIRVITDMVRVQTTPAGKQWQNYEAGIDLIEYLFNQCGFTTPVLVFCWNFLKGRENIANRKVRSDRFHQVTSSTKDLKEYMSFQNKLKALPKS